MQVHEKCELSREIVFHSSACTVWYIRRCASYNNHSTAHPVPISEDLLLYYEFSIGYKLHASRMM